MQRKCHNWTQAMYNSETYITGEGIISTPWHPHPVRRSMRSTQTQSPTMSSTQQGISTWSDNPHTRTASYFAIPLRCLWWASFHNHELIFEMSSLESIQSASAKLVSFIPDDSDQILIDEEDEAQTGNLEWVDNWNGNYPMRKSLVQRWIQMRDTHKPTHLNYRVIIQPLLTSCEHCFAINIKWPLTLISNVKVTIVTKLDQSLPSGYFPCRTLQGQVYINLVVLGGSANGDLWRKQVRFWELQKYFTSRRREKRQTSLDRIRYRTSRPLSTAKVWLSKSGALIPVMGDFREYL